MSYELFCKLIERTIVDFIPEKLGRCQAHISMADKVNNVKKIGLTIQKVGENSSPTIYLEDAYQDYMNGEPIENICVKLAKIYEQSMEKGVDTSFLEGFELENIKDKITMRIVNYKDNRMFLRDVPYKKVDDLAVYYVITIHTDRDSVATMLIRNEHQDALGITSENLHQLAMENTRKIYPPELGRTREKAHGINENLLETDIENDDGGLYYLTNTVGQFGAVNILYPDIAEKAKKIVGGDYYILPSSQHEVMLLSKEYGHDPKYIGEMIREINMTQVDKEDRLSDHAYEMDFDTKELRTVKESLPRQKEMER